MAKTRSDKTELLGKYKEILKNKSGYLRRENCAVDLVNAGIVE